MKNIELFNTIEEVQEHLKAVVDLRNKVLDDKGIYGNLASIGIDTSVLYHDIIQLEEHLSNCISVAKQTLDISLSVQALAERKYDTQDSNSGRDSR